MVWKDVANVVSTTAPVLGTAIGGPAGAAIGLAVSAIIKAFGLSDDATPEQIKQVIQTDPAAALKLMIAENEYKLKEKELENEELKTRLADTQGARTRQTESEKVTGKKDINLYVLAWIIVLGFFLLLGFLLKIPVPADQNGVVFMLFGALSTGFGQVLQYFFGSSKGSADKSATMAASLAEAKKEK